MNPCRKGHNHNTIEGKDRCDLKYADKRIARILAKGPPIYREIVYNPAKIVKKGIIQVAIFRTAEAIKNEW